MRYLFSRLLSKVPHPVKGLYEQNGVFDGVLIKNLNMIIVGGAFGTVFGTIVSGSTYAGFIKALDFSDFQYGLLLGIPIVANFSQLVASRVIERNGRRMKWFFISGFTHRAIWIVAAFIPYMFPDSVAESRIWAVLFIATLTAVSGSFINITFNSLLADVTPIGIRGKYLSIRSKIATLASMVVGLLAAWLLDSLHGFLPFTIVFIVAAFAGIYDISRFFHVKAPPMRLAEGKPSLLACFRQVLRNSRYKKYVLFWTVWTFSVNICSPFVTVYLIGPMGISFSALVIFGQITSNIVTVFFVSKWGAFIDKYGCKPILYVACTATGFSALFWSLATPGNAVVILFALSVLGGAMQSGIDLSSLNMFLTQTPSENKSSFMAIFSMVTSIVGGTTALILGGYFLDHLTPVMEGGDLRILFLHFDKYKVVICVSAILRIATAMVFIRLIEEDGGKPFAQAWRAALSGAVRSLRGPKV